MAITPEDLSGFYDEIAPSLRAGTISQFAGVELLQDQPHPLPAKRGEALAAVHFSDGTQQLMAFGGTFNAADVRRTKAETADYMGLLARMVDMGQAKWWSGAEPEATPERLSLWQVYGDADAPLQASMDDEVYVICYRSGQQEAVVVGPGKDPETGTSTGRTSVDYEAMLRRMQSEGRAHLRKSF